MFKAGPLYVKNLQATADVVVNQGGTSSGKTYAILQALFTKASQERNIVVTVVGQDVPNLKVGALRDAKEIVAGSPVLQSLIASYKDTERIYLFNNRSIIEFKSYSDAQDAKSGKRDYLFVNEANGIPYPVYSELALRTRKQIFIDYNPNEVFWVHDHILTQKETQLFISDHRHNPFCPPKLREKIESLRSKDYELWKVYARGKTGKIEGLIYSDYEIVEEFPDLPSHSYGADPGFNDPFAVVKTAYRDGILYWDEILYQSGLTKPQAIKTLKALGVDLRREWKIDDSEPDTVLEFYNNGFNAMKAGKGKIKDGIDKIKSVRLCITRRSTNLLKEIKSYKWLQDRNGVTLDEPVDFKNHALDAARYGSIHLIQSTLTPGKPRIFSTSKSARPDATDYD